VQASRRNPWAGRPRHKDHRGPPDTGGKDRDKQCDPCRGRLGIPVSWRHRRWPGDRPRRRPLHH
jgi:hypothetical protein